MTAHVAPALEQFFRSGAERSAQLGPDHAALWTALADAADGGKRVRPALLLAVHHTLGGRREHCAVQMAAAVELLHTAFVVHDDVIDGDHTRRGRPNVAGTFTAWARAEGAPEDRARTLGSAAGILAGDLALAGALRAVALCGAPPEVVRRLLDLVDRALHTSAGGELTDVRLSLGLGPVALGEVLTMEEHKTAVYSFELPMQAGAVLAGASDATVTGLGEVARLLGLSFQLRDDVLGVFGDQVRTGKSSLGDLREGKRTPMVAHASTSPVWPELTACLGDPALDEQGADRARALLEQAGSRAFVEDLAADYAAAAVHRADELGMPRELLTWMTRLTDELAAA